MCHALLEYVVSFILKNSTLVLRCGRSDEDLKSTCGRFDEDLDKNSVEFFLGSVAIFMFFLCVKFSIFWHCTFLISSEVSLALHVSHQGKLSLALHVSHQEKLSLALHVSDLFGILRRSPLLVLFLVF